jgi:hypothetical protein
MAIPQSEQTVDNSSDTACDVGRVYGCHYLSFNVAGDSTVLTFSLPN